MNGSAPAMGTVLTRGYVVRCDESVHCSGTRGFYCSLLSLALSPRAAWLNFISSSPIRAERSDSETHTTLLASMAVLRVCLVPDWPTPGQYKTQGQTWGWITSSTTTASTLRLHLHNMPNNTPCPLKPMKIVEQGDILMGQAQGLYGYLTQAQEALETVKKSVDEVIEV
ncbi:hypothetical protein EI94DRAFT_283703 [Lactarius quietus]|nr:hypothetical protein EI94DRAFT_283703 [Lactarius quietus]